MWIKKRTYTQDINMWISYDFIVHFSFPQHPQPLLLLLGLLLLNISTGGSHEIHS